MWSSWLSKRPRPQRSSQQRLRWHCRAVKQGGRRRIRRSRTPRRLPCRRGSRLLVLLRPSFPSVHGLRIHNCLMQLRPLRTEKLAQIGAARPRGKVCSFVMPRERSRRVQKFGTRPSREGPSFPQVLRDLNHLKLRYFRRTSTSQFRKTRAPPSGEGGKHAPNKASSDGDDRNPEMS